MRLRSKFLFGFDDWEKVQNIIKDNSSIKNKAYLGNYYLWTETEEAKRVVENYLIKQDVRVVIDWEYQIVENSDIIGKFKVGDKVRFKTENIIAGEIDLRETDWYKGTMHKVVPSNIEIAVKRDGDMEEIWSFSLRAGLDGLRAIEKLKGR